MTNIENFSSKVKSGLETVDWNAKRDIIRALVKRIEINLMEVKVVFRIKELSHTSGGIDPGQNRSQHYCKHHQE